MSKASLKSNLAPDVGLRETRASGWPSRGADKQVLSLRETVARACLYASGISGLWLLAFLALKLSGGTWP